jgi:ATP phosphoribosyltransferase
VIGRSDESPCHRKVDVTSHDAPRLKRLALGRSDSLLDYDVLRAKLREAETNTPGFDSPMLSALESSQKFAARVMVKRPEVIAVVERHEVPGASAILETKIADCRLWRSTVLRVAGAALMRHNPG